MKKGGNEMVNSLSLEDIEPLARRCSEDLQRDCEAYFAAIQLSDSDAEDLKVLAKYIDTMLMSGGVG